MAQNSVKLAWLVEYLYRSPKKTFREISEHWTTSSVSDGDPLSHRTFFKWKDAIADTYGLDIVCDSQHRYYIENADDLASNELNKWMIRSLSVSNTLHSYSHLGDRILLDTIPSGEYYLDQILSAIKTCRVIEFDYTSYYKQERKHNVLKPYCVKFFEQRWYVVGYRLSKKTEEEGMRTFSLDNMDNVTIKNTKFAYPVTFSPQAHFQDVFGVITGYEKPVENIHIKVDKFRAAYWINVPLHHSQTIIEDADDHVVFSLNLKPMNDFYQRLLHDATHIEVLSPTSVREEFASIIRQLYDLYAEPQTEG